MRGRPNWIKITGWAVALFIAGSVAAAAIRGGSWDPVYTAGWLIPVIVATTSGNSTGRCLPRRGRGRRAGEGRASG